MSITDIREENGAVRVFPVGHIATCVEQAKKLAQRYDKVVVFFFNEIPVYVNKRSNVEKIVARYMKAIRKEN